MSALVIVDLTVTNQDKFEEYRSKGPSTVEKYGGEFIANGEVLTLHGQSLYEMKVVIQFPNRDKALDWYKSPEYRILIPIREQGMRSQFHLVG